MILIIYTIIFFFASRWPMMMIMRTPPMLPFPRTPRTHTHTLKPHGTVHFWAYASCFPRVALLHFQLSQNRSTCSVSIVFLRSHANAAAWIKHPRFVLWTSCHGAQRGAQDQASGVTASSEEAASQRHRKTKSMQRGRMVFYSRAH